jgi:hypothetical protein
MYVNCKICHHSRGEQNDRECPCDYHARREEVFRKLLLRWVSQCDGLTASDGDLFISLIDDTRKALGIEICKTCKGTGSVLYFYNQGPHDPIGNQYIPCPVCVANA